MVLEGTVDTKPRLVGQGPVTFSTSLELTAPFQIVFDTNGYYRELGLRPGATRREIREAYQEREGWKSTRLTYILTVLLDPEARAAYDRTPLGSFKVDDYILDQWHRERVREVVRLRREGKLFEAAEWADSEPEWLEENLSQVPGSLDPNGYSDEWPWAFYLWGSQQEDTQRLRRWQRLLVSILGQRKEHHQIAVGLSRHRGPWGVRTVGYRTVVFLDDREQPTEVLAMRAASRVVKHIDIRRTINNVGESRLSPGRTSRGRGI